jgi:hypothetical protein
MNADHTAPRRRRGRAEPPTEAEILAVPSRLEAVIANAVTAIEGGMDELTAMAPVDPENLAKIVELAEKSSEILGRVNRARDAATRRKPTLPMIEKFVADLAPDERATLLDRLGSSAGERNVLS